MKDLKVAVVVALAVGFVGCIFAVGMLRWYGRNHPWDFPGPGRQDYTGHLAGDYWIYRTSAYQTMIGPEDGWTDGDAMIPTVVSQCATDGRYILAERHGLKRRSPNDPTDTFEVEDPSQVNFWILDTETRKMFGPLDEPQFKSTRASLSIDPALELRGAYEFRDRSESKDISQVEQADAIKQDGPDA